MATPGHFFFLKKMSSYRSKTRLNAEYIKLKYPILKSASAAMTTLMFSAVDSEPARTARMANATTRTIEKKKKKVVRTLSSTNVQKQ